jgi:hypothetical protein
MIRKLTPSFLCLCLATSLMAQQAGGGIASSSTQKQAPPLPENPEPALPSGWDRVRDLAHYEEISVKTDRGRSFHCHFSGATTDYLFCEPTFDWFGGREGYQLNRAEVEDIRMDDQRRNFKIVVGSMAAAGFVTLAVCPRNNNGTPWLLNGLAGSAVGALAGVIVGLPVSIFVPGRRVYRRPDQRPENPSSLTEPAHTRPVATSPW